MGDKKATSRVLGVLTGGSLIPMTEGIRKTEDNRKDKLQNQIDELKSLELVSGTALKDTTAQTLQDAATTQAQDTVKKKRKTLLNTGGETDLTQGAGILSSGQVKKKTLLGG